MPQNYRQWARENTDVPVDRIKVVPGGFADSEGNQRGVEPTITALWAAVNVLQQDVAELQREIFEGDPEE